ncbi:peptidase M23 [Capnocytophaga canimorsus]|uniref:Peptidase M23 n=1 Tax=Capnocytophaga canimorsus TaxID=28188 RepID=A0A250G236_9FLAO|nr:peptidoglycan DD-metalloendopeptidase family protein [Capnocytophaga canimorsus]ATA91452.1 peptidase M23 [Capnocytophaga canimorsus]
MKRFLRKSSAVVSLIALFWACEEKGTEKEIPQVVEEVKKAPVFEFGFNLDEYNIVKDTVKSGDTFGKILGMNNFGISEIHQISDKTKSVFDPRTLRAGRAYAFLFDKQKPEKPHSFVYQPSLTDYVVVQLADSIYAYNQKRKITIIEKEGIGTIKSNLTESVLDAGMTYNVAFNLSQIFDYTVDFFHLREGDTFKIIYEERYVDDTIYAGVSNVKAAYFEHKGNPYYAFNYTTDSIANKKGFYDEKGNTMKRMFLKAPLEIFRISSRFGMRFHPVLHRMKAHKGTDYAAPHGTPIRCTASGTVIEAGYNAGNGNYVKIRHNKTYTTQYLHMSKILVKKGQHVPQGHVIGKVGSTGLATGPHVCYRFWKNGVQVDPLREALPPSEPIEDKYKTKYMEYITPLKNQLDQMLATPIEQSPAEMEQTQVSQL